MILRKTVLLAGAFALTAGVAQAATVLESFNDFPNGPKPSFTSQGFTYTPTKTTNGQCFESLCLQEADQKEGEITTITYMDGQETFDFFGFYLNFNGLTATDDFNFLTISDGSSSIGLNLVETFSEMMLDMVWSVDITGSSTTITELSGDDKFDFDSSGFFIGLGDAFDDVDFITLSSDGQGTIRIDCAYYGVGDAASPDYGELTGCEASTPEIPLPGGLPLMASALGLAGILRHIRR